MNNKDLLTDVCVDNCPRTLRFNQHLATYSRRTGSLEVTFISFDSTNIITLYTVKIRNQTKMKNQKKELINEKEPQDSEELRSVQTRD